VRRGSAWSWTTFTTATEAYTYGMTARITARSTIRLNCSAIVGDIVANRRTVISAATIASPAPGTPWRLTRPNTAGNIPSSAAAFADWPTSSIHPPSEPTDLRIAQSATTTIPDVPIASRAASAKGACDVRSSAFGMIPMITVELRM
jgi:hypothetical protein